MKLKSLLKFKKKERLLHQKQKKQKSLKNRIKELKPH